MFGRPLPDAPMQSVDLDGVAAASVHVFARPLPEAPARAVDLDDVAVASLPASSERTSTASAAAAGPGHKRPRRQRRGDARDRQVLCHGLPGQTCRFAADGSGARAQGKHGGRCVFCDESAMAQALGTPAGRGNIVRFLKQWRQAGSDTFDVALSRSTLASLPDEDRQGLRLSAELPVRRPVAQPAGRAAEALGRRRAVTAAPSAQQLQAYRAGVAEDRAYVRRKFFPQRDRRVRHADFRWKNPMPANLHAKIHDQAFNDTGLPDAHVTDKARLLELWCKQHSWKVCRLCATVQPQHLKEADLREKTPTALAKCKNCSKPEETRLWVPSAEEVPLPLRGLPREVLLSLRPLDIDCGPEWKADYGYYFHSTMIRFSWSQPDVLAKIDTLDGRNRKIAKKAFDFLMGSDASSYRSFVQRHRRFLRDYPNADAERRKRPLRFLEEEAVECALWPHLYWDWRLCETSTRLADVRRRARAVEAVRAAAGGADESDVEEEDVEHATRQSLRRSFLAKAMGPIADYAGDHELVHFVFDLFMWSDVGGKKGALPGTPMWQAMKGAPWTPQFWKVRHAAALDMQAQCGFPVAFFTWAPFEWSAPYHQWVLRQMEQLGKFGAATSNWQTSLFGGHRSDGSRVRVNFVGRLEFQDGKRKEATQDYHGRAAVHLHGLVFADEVGPSQLHTKICATVPPEGDPLRGYVLDGQAGRTGSGLPRQEEASYCDATTDTVHLRHSFLDKRLGIRGYSPEFLDVFKCHQDVQIQRGTGLMLKYAATYLPKFSDGPGKELMDDGSSAYAAARRVLFTFHPGEPEMWLLLASQAFPMYFLGGTMRPIIAPHPGMPKKPDYVRQYEAAAWRGQMTLLEFLRRVNAKGAILEHIRKSHAASGTESILEEYALRFQTFGEKVVAAEMVSMTNDKFYGQWLALHVPFQQLEDLLVHDIVARVPDGVKFLACALHLAPEVWRQPAAIRAYMEVRAHRDTFIETVLSMISAQAAFVEQHLDGRLSPPGAVAIPMRPSYVGDDSDELQFTASQSLLETYIDRRVDQALRIRATADDVEYERLVGLAEEHGSMVAATGPPGTGKTAVLDRCIRRAESLGARILIALPTGVQRSRMRQRHPNVDLDTCHGAFLFHRPLTEALGIVAAYDLIVVDEAFQLVEEHFERLHQMWVVAARVPCLVLAGDEWQLPPPDRTQRSLACHPRWRFVCKVELHHVWRQDGGDPLLSKLTYLRKSRPTGREGDSLLRDLCRGHKAWSGHHEPTGDDIKRLLERTDGGGTTVITCTRRGAALVNRLFQAALFPRPTAPALGRVPADYECNPVNYDDTGKLLDRLPQPLHLTLHEGLRVRLTRNVDKPNDFVNGMAAVVLGFDPRRHAIVVETESKHCLCVYPITTDDVPGGRLTYYPVKLGYADTVHKYQGAELSHVTFWPDRPGCPAAGYVALSRVKRDADYLLGGCVKPEHFLPAR
ncbi:unnamed protein product [Symbiodinium natans]|uniref:AAA+ ATPase domain-containing protein n=1 Tax=Symbiodinium natans TaxID=878477 RepID=A0A812IMQ4_9DINO|nr:unnamed protein product [Symbiodinium natans]